MGKDVAYTLIVDQQFGYVRLAAPLTLRGSVLIFVGRSVLSFVSFIR